MPDPAPLPEPLLREHRERTITALCEHFAHDRIGMEELERRIDLAQRARAATELTALLQDLAPAVPDSGTTPVVRSQPRSSLAERDRAGNSVILAILGGVERRGPWRPAARSFVVGLMGGADLDFRDAELPPGETEVFVLALMGGVDIVVPPDMAVDASGLAIMGGFGHIDQPRALPPDAPILRIRGLALMGGVDITVRHPGESARDARIRRKEARRARRRPPGS